MKKVSIVTCENYKKNTVDPKSPVCKIVSSLKLGDKKAIFIAKEEILKKIKFSVPDITQNNEDWLVANCPSKINSCSAAIIAKEISRVLKIKYIKIRLKKEGKKFSSYGFSASKKLTILRKTLYCRNLNIKGKGIILVDDVVATSSAMRSSSELLMKKGAKIVKGFAYLKLKDNLSNLETEMASLNYNIFGKKYLINLLNNQDNIITSKLLNILLKMPDPRIKKFLTYIKKSRKEELVENLVYYSGLSSRTLRVNS